MIRKPLLGTAAAALAFLACTADLRAQYERRTALVEAVEKTRDAVVNIKVTRRSQVGNLKEVVGSGVIIDARGYVLTNQHVVGGCERVVVVLRDGTELPTTVHTEDRGNDLAILKVRPDRKLKELRFAPGSDLMVGETVIAVGNPHGYQNTVTVGIISALGREITMPTGAVLANLIQHSASINPGNSGGPLLNVNGELIGINVAMRNEAQSMAFALNADTVQKALAKHLAAAKIGAAGHGLAVHEEVRSAEGDGRQQLVVDAVPQSGPAARAGLKPGDVLLKVGGQAVGNRFDLERAFWEQKDGEVVAVVGRSGREVAVTLPVGERTASLPRND